ncbi:hypothetical protein DESUT3_36760 [Desulfuromonas versatilis]|uniref:Negative regulator of flagellin synthesis n=1 Tax=Desulfuromonas versatilis TaxID=2802975 RepID=A0ABM8HWB6_9BACT|nr:flagellar biosynthesis anti-sigma factor FlgM [Desulfuromonas versatilis]BCR06607.1 hypothetical protein DESUT3_36760 [Desulfuromonas versatilis]
MSIDKIFGGKSVGPIEPVKRNRELDSSKAKESGAPKDRVEFSSVLQEASKAKQADPAQAAERAQKVAALKAQVASGSYRPDLEKVAESLLRFMAEDK